MNKYLITIRPGQVLSAETVESVINLMLPEKVASLYTHFLQPNGMELCAQPLAVSWWRDPGAIPAILLLIDWQARSAAMANRLMYLSQEIASGNDTPAHALLRNLNRAGYTEQYHARVVAVQELLAALSAIQAPITHAYSARTGPLYGSVVGLELTAGAKNWITRSLALLT